MDQETNSGTKKFWGFFLAFGAIIGFVWTLYGVYQELTPSAPIDAPQFRQTIDQLLENERDAVDK